MGLGIGSLILGVISLPFALIPCLGMFSLPLSGLGLVLGILGLVFAFRQEGQNIGLAISGTSVSGLSIAFGLLWLILFGAAAAVSKPGSTTTASTTSTVGGTDSGTKTTLTDANFRKTNPAPDGFNWAKVGSSYEGNDLKITIPYACVDRVPGFEDQPYLYVKLKVENTSASRAITWRGWEKTGNASDEFNRQLEFVHLIGVKSGLKKPDRIPDWEAIKDDSQTRDIEPLKSYSTLLFLDKYDRMSNELHLTMPVSAFYPNSREVLYFNVRVKRLEGP